MERFANKKYQLGQADCGRMVVFHLVQMKRPVTKISKLKPYKTAVSARRAIEAATGQKSLDEALTARFPEIAPAAARIGDIVQLPCELEIGALGIHIGNGAVMAYSEEHELPVTARIVTAEKAWRIVGSG